MTTKGSKREVSGEGMKAGRVAVGERGKELKRKCRKVVEVTEKEGDEETLEEEEAEAEAEMDAEEFQMPEVVGMSLNLSKRNLKELTAGMVRKMSSVQYLYLEGNKLTALPQEFFQRLHFLKWLDLRNNNLTTLPTLGLRNHPSLEVILLQENRVRNLPLELATIPSLKGLQITGNPIANVPYEVIAGGFQQIMKFLEKTFSQEEILLPASKTVLVKASTSRDNPVTDPSGKVNDPSEAELRMWDLDKLSQWRQFMKKKSENLKVLDSKYPVTTKDKSVSQQPKISVSVRSHPKPTLKPQPFRCGVYSKSRHRSTASALRYLRMRKTRLGYKRRPITAAMVQEKALKEAFRAQVRETLEKQARKIQRMRDKEVLRSWRDHAKVTHQQMKLLDNYQQYPSKDFASKTPFDVDPEFLTMLKRVDLYRSLKDYDNKSKRVKKPRVRITALDLERQMNEIIKKLQQLDTNDSEDSSPRTKQGHMCSKMYKIMDIQKTLKNLQTLNSSMNGIIPIVKPKPKH